MTWLIWIGAAVTLVGVIVLFMCILSVAKARRAGLTEADLRARLQRAVALNLGALFLSTLGLMMVVTGILLS